MYKELPHQVKDTIERGSKAYKTLVESWNFKYIVIENINCAELPEPKWVKGNPAPSELDYIWSKLPDNNTPCLYFFEIKSPDTNTILKTYEEFRFDKTLKHRSKATLKKRPPLSTNVLYVGKVKDDIGGRMVVHFAYYHVGGTAGLQLACWAKKIKLTLTLHIYAFNKNMHDFVTPLELPFAHSLNPLIGKH